MRRVVWEWAGAGLGVLVVGAAVAAAFVVTALASGGGVTVSVTALPSGMTTPPVQGAIGLPPPTDGTYTSDPTAWFTTYNGSRYGLAKSNDPTSSSSVSALPASFAGGSGSYSYPAMVALPGVAWLVGDDVDNLYGIDGDGYAHAVITTANDDRDLTAAPTGEDQLYLSNHAGEIDQYSVTSTPSATLVNTYQTPSGVFPDAIASAGAFVWFSDDRGDLFRMTTTGVVTAITTAHHVVSDGARTMVGDYDGDLWAISYGTSGYGNAVLKIDPSTGAVIATYSAGIPPGDVLTSLSLGEGGLWFPEAGSTPAIGQLDLGTGTITSYPLPSGYSLQSTPQHGSAIAAGPGCNPSTCWNVWFTARTSGGDAAVGEVSLFGPDTTTVNTTSTSTTPTKPRGRLVGLFTATGGRKNARMRAQSGVVTLTQPSRLRIAVKVDRKGRLRVRYGRFSLSLAPGAYTIKDRPRLGGSSCPAYLTGRKFRISNINQPATSVEIVAGQTTYIRINCFEH